MFSCKLGTKEKTWVSLSQSLKRTHTLLFQILSHFSFFHIHFFSLSYYFMHLCMCLEACFLHSASSLAVTTSPHVKQFTQRPHPGETLRALMEEMPMSEWSNSGEFHGQTTLHYNTLTVYILCNYVNIYTVPNAQVVLWPPKDKSLIK